MVALAAVALAAGGPAAAAAGPVAAAAGPGGSAAARGSPASGVISTVAGGAGGPARATRVALSSACGVSAGARRLYVADGTSVRQVTPGTDELTTPAGTGVSAPLGDGGLATRADLDDACSVAVDRSGNLLIADVFGQRVRAVAASTGSFYGQAMTAGHIYTVAGTGTQGYSGDGGPAASAELAHPFGVAVDADGNLLIADFGNDRIRLVAASTGSFYGQAMTVGHIYTVAGDGGHGFSGDGGPATGAELSFPQGVATDAAGNLLIADSGNARVRVVAARSGTFYGRPMTAGDIYTIAGTGTYGFSGDGGPATGAELNQPASAAVDAAGNVLIADTYNNRIRVVAAHTGTFYGQPMTAGDIYTIAGGGTSGRGDGGPATSAELRRPQGVAVDPAGNVVIADAGLFRVRVVAARTGTSYGQPMTAGDIYTVAGTGKHGFCGDGGPATSAELRLPQGIATGAAGNLLIADTGNNRIRVAAARSGTFYGRPMTAGDIYTVAGDGTAGFSGDGGPATSAELRLPQRVAADAAGNLLIADTYNNRIRVVAARTGTFYSQAMTVGHIYTVAGDGTAGFSGDGGPATGADLNHPGDVATDPNGNLLIADGVNNRVRVVAARSGTFYGRPMTAGDIYTVAGDGTAGFSGDGGPATGAELNQPASAAVDAAGNLLIADTGNDRIRVVAARSGTFYGQAMTVGHIYTVAGDGGHGFSGDGGPATSAHLSFPQGAATDAAGNLLIADSANERVRVVADRTGAFYGRPMTAGDIYTVAGTGTQGYSGDGGRATGAELASPPAVAPGANGSLLIADSGSNRIRMVTG